MGDRYEQGAVPAAGLEAICSSEAMNRAFLIILVPAALVAAGYIFVFRAMGIAPGYTRLFGAMAIFLGLIYWLSRKSGGKAGSGNA